MASSDCWRCPSSTHQRRRVRWLLFPCWHQRTCQPMVRSFLLILSSTNTNTVPGPSTVTQTCTQTQRPSIPIVGYLASIQLSESHSTSTQIYRTSQHSALGVAFVPARISRRILSTCSLREWLGPLRYQKGRELRCLSMTTLRALTCNQNHSSSI